jgi:hypothetical protein
MTQDEIIDMAEICSVKARNQTEFIELFAKLVTQHEREACAKVCEDSYEYAGDTLAEAIRARGKA